GLTDGNISSHMGRLRDAGYATICKEFVGNRPRTVYALTTEGRTALTGYLATVQAAATALLPG
ncbi:MAG: transcriptional regulator, partial [Actinomycetota bacterium]|nr:transcriptional regulator [Actinomycetota bacterium]